MLYTQFPSSYINITLSVDQRRSLTDCGSRGMSETLVDGRKQIIQNRLSNINSIDSDNATDSFILPASSSGSKGSLGKTSLILSATTSSILTFILQAAVTSFTVSAAATSSTVLYWSCLQSNRSSSTCRYAAWISCQLYQYLYYIIYTIAA
jgi:hypothetical protein